MYRQNIDKQWRKRTRKLTSKYATGMVSNTATKNAIREVREADTMSWVVATEKKPAMTNYLKGKNEIRKKTVYDNSKGSSLLFEARSGCLRTRSYKATCTKGEYACACCGKAKQTMEHILLACEEIYPAARLGPSDLLLALGFRDSKGKVNKSAIEISNRWLEVWWQKSRETTNNGVHKHKHG